MLIFPFFNESVFSSLYQFTISIYSLISCLPIMMTRDLKNNNRKKTLSITIVRSEQCSCSDICGVRCAVILMLLFPIPLFSLYRNMRLIYIHNQSTWERYQQQGGERTRNTPVNVWVCRLALFHDGWLVIMSRQGRQQAPGTRQLSL